MKLYRRVRRRRRRPRRDQPVDPDARRQGARARREGVARRERARSATPSGTSTRRPRSSTTASSLARREGPATTSGSTARSASSRNGAGLAMSTLDVVQPGRRIGRELPRRRRRRRRGGDGERDRGDQHRRERCGRSSSTSSAASPSGDEVANGIVQPRSSRCRSSAPIVIRLDGTNAEEGRAILKPHESDRLISQPTMLEAARKAVELAGSSAVDEHLRRRRHEGRLPGPHRWPGPLLRAAQPRVRHAGRRRHEPEEGRHRRRGHPGLRDRSPTRVRADRARPRRASSFPRPGPRTRCSKPPKPGIEFIVVITEGVPAHDEACFYNAVAGATSRDTQLLGPELSRASSTPGKCNIGITPGEIALRGRAGRASCRARARSPIRRCTR